MSVHRNAKHYLWNMNLGLTETIKGVAVYAEDAKSYS